MRDNIVSVVDFLSYVVVFALTIVGLITGSAFGGLGVVLGGLCGFIAGAFSCGFWLALSGIYWKLGAMPVKELPPISVTKE